MNRLDNIHDLASRFGDIVRKKPGLTIGLTLTIPVLFLYLFALSTLEIRSKLLFSTAMTLLVFFVGAISLDLEVGSLGLPNFGKVAFFALGAYISALLYSVYDVSYPVAVIVAVIVSCIFGYILSIPTVKLRDDYFAIMTIAGGEFIRFVFQNEKRWLWAPSILPPHTPTQVISNRAKIELTTMFPFNMRLGDLELYKVLEAIEDFIYTILSYIGIKVRIFESLDLDQLFLWEITLLLVFSLIAILTYWFIERIRRSPYGRTLRAIREDDISVTSVGKDVSRFRWQITTISAFICGLAGVMYAFSFNAFEASDFKPELTFVLYFYIIIGGLGNSRGVLLGTALVTLFMQAASVESVQRTIFFHVGPDSPYFGTILEILQLDIFINPYNTRYVVLGSILILFLLFKPGGLIPEPRTENEKYLSLLTSRERARSDEAVFEKQSLTEKERFSISREDEKCVIPKIKMKKDKEMKLMKKDEPEDYHLEAENIHKYFGGIRALEGASVFVKRNKLVSLIGPNGSGKTTLFNVITCWLSKTDLSGEDTGKVIFEKNRIDGLNAHEAALTGMIRTFQTTRNWPKLTVLENLLVAPHNQTGESFVNIFFKQKKIKEEERKNIVKSLEILEFLEIMQIRDQRAEELSGGQMKLLALGRLLMTVPRLILLDEPMAGVNPSLGNKIMDKILELKKETTIFLIEHNMDVVFNYSDEIFVMASGKIIAHGTPDEIETNREVIEAYLGKDY